MAEYIEREALLELREEMWQDRCDHMVVRVTNIMNIPAADVAPVVRCKDCKHNVANWNHDELDVTDYTDITCDFFMTDGMEPDDFCSYGERRADNA